MSHEITAIDRQQGIRQAWHKLTEIREWIGKSVKAILADCWLAQWDVSKSPLHRTNATGQIVASDYCEMVCSDNPDIVVGTPVHRDTYVPLTNRDFLALIEDALSGIHGAQIESVGSVCSRGRVFVSVALQQLESFKAAGREFRAYLNFLNSHDMSASFVMNTSNTCTVCNNTFQANLHSPDKGAIRVRLKHTKGMANRLANVPEVVAGHLGAQAEFAAIMDTLATQEIAQRHARGFFAGFLTLPDMAGNVRKVVESATSVSDIPQTIREDLKQSSRKLNQIDRLTELFAHGAGNRGRDLSDVFSAVSDYYTHESSGGSDVMRQFVSSEFGAGQTAKERAWSVLKDKAEINRHVKIGNAVLALN